MPLPSVVPPVPMGVPEPRWALLQQQAVNSVAAGYLQSYTTAQRNALLPGGNPAIVFDKTLGKAVLWTGSAWQVITST